MNNVLWIIGGGQLQVPLIREAKKLDLLTLVTDRDSKCVAKNSADYFYPVDIFDIDENIKLLFRLRQEGIKLTGVIAAGIDANVTAAVVAKLAGLPGVDPYSAYLTHYKPAFRRFMEKAGLPMPKWREIATLAEASEAIEAIGVPFIIKNIDNSGSRGTKKFFEKPDDEELIQAVNEAMSASTSKTALVEELLSGSEHTIETVFDVNGKFHRCFITDREFDASNEWAVETGLRHPSALPKAQQEQMYEITKRAAELLGIMVGPAKVDMMMTENGPRIIEMTTRFSGGFDCQYLVPAATGKNILKAGILVALGKMFPPELLNNRKHQVGVTGSTWPEPGKIIEIKGVDEAKKMPGVVEVFLRYKVGDTVLSYVDSTRRACFVIVIGENEVEARARLKHALDTIEIVTE